MLFYFFFFWKKLIICIIYNLELIHFLITKYLQVWWVLWVCGWNNFFITLLFFFFWLENVRPYLVFFFSLLITHHSIFVTHHSSLKNILISYNSAWWLVWVEYLSGFFNSNTPLYVTHWVPQKSIANQVYRTVTKPTRVVSLSLPSSRPFHNKTLSPTSETQNETQISKPVCTKAQHHKSEWTLVGKYLSSFQHLDLA